MDKKIIYKLTIKETNGHVLKPSYSVSESTDPGRAFVENFFGCHEPDVVEYSIERIVA